MVNNTYIGVGLIYHTKLTLIHPVTTMTVVCEIKIWSLVNSAKYPQKIKYSLFCVELESGNILVGYDNHFPKGPHVHQNDTEEFYQFVDCDKLLEDFWSEVEKRGFSI